MTKFVNYALILACILLGYGWAKSYLTGPDIQQVTVYRTKPSPKVAPETKASERMQEETRCVQVEVKKPTLKELEAIAKKYEAPKLTINWPDATLLGEYEVPKMPYGGTTAVVVEGTTPTVVTLPKPRPFFELGGMREVGIGVGVGSYSPTWRGKFRQDLLRVGPVIGTIEVSSTGYGSQSYWSALLEANVRF